LVLVLVNKPWLVLLALVFCLLHTAQAAAVAHDLEPSRVVELEPRRGGGGGGGGGANAGGGTGTVGTGPPDDTPPSGFPGPSTGVTGSVTDTSCSAFINLAIQILVDLFGGQCVDNARSAIRLAYADAATFTISGGGAGGADGSIILDPNESLRPENQGLTTYIEELLPIIGMFTASTADVIQLAATLAISVCPGSPRAIPFFMGRKDFNGTANPTGLLSQQTDSVAKMVARFADMGFTSDQMVALIGAHTIGRQGFTDPSLPGASFDSTNNIWDSTFFTETSAAAAINDTFSEVVSNTPIFRLESDLQIAHDASTGPLFSLFGASQAIWATEFSTAWAEFNILGQNKSSLVQCDALIPNTIPLSSIQDPDGSIDPFLLQQEITTFFGQYSGIV